MKYKIFAISDIHIGASNDEDLLNQLDKYFFHNIFVQKPHIVVVCGDLSHDKLSMNSISGKVYLKFAKELMELCGRLNIKLRIIMGTRSHDKDQLDIFEIEDKYINYDLDMKIIRTVQSEKIFTDLNLLYIPEEYIGDKDKYYNNYLSKEYDFIFMHGLVTDATVIAKHQESEATHLKAPVFKTEELIDIVNGLVISGHIHGHSIFKDKFYYIGSFTRWRFGEEESKGFLVITYNTDDFDYKVEFIENKDAPLLYTITLGEGSPIFNMDVFKAMEELIKLKETLKCDKLRFKINIPENYEYAKLFVDSIRDIFNLNKDVILLIKSNAKETHEKQVKDQIETLMRIYDYIFDETILPEKKISRFIKNKFDKEISEQNIVNYIYK